MTQYNAPIEEMAFVINVLHNLDSLADCTNDEQVSADLLVDILNESNKLMSQVWSPLNEVGDRSGVRLETNGVKTCQGFADAYRQYSEGGWSSLYFDPAYGGQGLPFSFSMPVAEMTHAANMALGLCPMLTAGAVETVSTYASQTLKDTYLEKMVTGTWTGTMNLTEPHAGTDLGELKTTATLNGEHYLIKGQKIFITWGDHDMTDNVVHLVLARLPDAPAGVKGISLFLVPKFLPDEVGNLTHRNDLKAINVEHKLGIHGSPTCVMSYGDNGGATGYLVGELNKGLIAIFTMMNNERLLVGLQGVSLADRAYQDALAYAKERVQCVPPNKSKGDSIIHHPDVRRMLMTMRSLTEAARAICYLTARDIDMSHLAKDAGLRQTANQRVGLFTPIAKGWCSEIAQEVTSLCIQIHGGMGFIEETGVAQFYRDARILPIYEGTTGIQALDLVGRKTLHDEGAAMALWLEELQQDFEASKSYLTPCQTKNMVDAIEGLQATTSFLLDHGAQDATLPGAISFDVLMQSGYVAGGWQMMLSLTKVDATDNETFRNNKKATAAYYLEHILPRALSYHRSVVAGNSSVMAILPEAF